MDLKDYRAKQAVTLPKRRRKIGMIVGIIHFFASSFVVLNLLGSAMQPIPDDSDALWFIPFFILMFPGGLVALIGFPLVIFAVPFQSVLWGWATSRLLIRE